MKNFILVSLVMIAMLSCHKEENNSYTNEYVDPSIISQEFDIGSYWIYENDSTHITDCTYVNNVHTGYYEYCAGHANCGYIHYYDIFFYYSNTLNGYPYDWERLEGWSIMRNPTPYYQNLLRGPEIYNGKSSDTGSLVVGNFVFHQVQKATIDSTDFYTAKSVGLVKKVFHDSAHKGVWNIIRWNIVK